MSINILVIFVISNISYQINKNFFAKMEKQFYCMKEYKKYLEEQETLLMDGKIEKIKLHNQHALVDRYDYINDYDPVYILLFYERLYPYVTLPSRFFVYIEGHYDMAIEYMQKYPDLIPTSFHIDVVNNKIDKEMMDYMEKIFNMGQTKFIFDMDLIILMLCCYDEVMANFIMKCFCHNLCKISTYRRDIYYNHDWSFSIKCLSKVLDLFDTIEYDYDPMYFIENCDIDCGVRITKLYNYFISRGKQINSEKYAPSGENMFRHFEKSFIKEIIYSDEINYQDVCEISTDMIRGNCDCPRLEDQDNC